MKHLGSLERTQEARVAPAMPRATLLSPLQNPCCFLSPTYIQECWHTHQLINSAFQTSCKVNCPKIMTKFNLVFTKASQWRKCEFFLFIFCKKKQVLLKSKSLSLKTIRVLQRILTIFVKSKELSTASPNFRREQALAHSCFLMRRERKLWEAIAQRLMQTKKIG